MSPTVHRLVLELIERQALALAKAIHDATEVPSEIATLQGIALAGVFFIIIIIITEAGQRTRVGQSQQCIAAEPQPIIPNVLTELDRWLSAEAAGRMRTR